VDPDELEKLPLLHREQDDDLSILAKDPGGQIIHEVAASKL